MRQSHSSDSPEAAQVLSYIDTITTHLPWHRYASEPSSRNVKRLGFWAPDKDTFWALHQLGERRRFRPHSVKIMGSLLLHQGQEQEQAVQYAVSAEGRIAVRTLAEGAIAQAAIDALYDIGKTGDSGMTITDQAILTQALALAAQNPERVYDIRELQDARETKSPETE